MISIYTKKHQNVNKPISFILHQQTTKFKSNKTNIKLTDTDVIYRERTNKTFTISYKMETVNKIKIVNKVLMLLFFICECTP